MMNDYWIETPEAGFGAKYYTAVPMAVKQPAN